MLVPRSRRTSFDFRDAAFSFSGGHDPTPGISRSITYLGIAGSFSGCGIARESSRGVWGPQLRGPMFRGVWGGRRLAAKLVQHERGAAAHGPRLVAADDRETRARERHRIGVAGGPAQDVVAERLERRGHTTGD